MRTKVVNNRLEIFWPEGFHEMSKEEIGHMSSPFGAPAFCLKDPERHIILAAGCRTINGFSAMMLNVNDLADRMKKDLEGQMQPFGCHFDDPVNIKIGTAEAGGWRYGYTVQDTPMCAESLVLKDGKDLYYLHFYYREALKEESLPVIEEILKGSGLK
ncbi:MAG: hypothetical protein IKG55_07425 [Solobacterium sp.]|nr:hypothetical protein [Solobacterium sp.]